MKNNKFIKFFYRWIYALTQIFPRPIILFLPRYLLNWKQLSKMGNSIALIDTYPCLTDHLDHTPFDPHYLYQSAWLARRLAVNIPYQHYDVGSDVRMVSVLSAFVQTVFLDYRPLEIEITGLTCKRDDLIGLSLVDNSIESISCLHVVEHVGLGRYGDRLDPNGSLKALNELKRVLAPKGRLYLSLPVGRERICYNAHRVFNPGTIIEILSDLQLIEFSLIDDGGAFHELIVPRDISNIEYGCGLFIFEKKSKI